MKQDILERIELTGLVPVVRIESADLATPLAEALRRGGLNCAEITFRTEQAAAAIRAIRARFPDMLLGAGTVRSPDQVDEALEAGADFIVTAGLNADLVRCCQRRGVSVLPGVVTPTEIELALSLGLTAVKFFPAQASGGVAMMRSLAAPYGSLRFLPTGGIGEEQLEEYFSFAKTLACGGSWMVGESLLRQGQWRQITQLTRRAVETMLGCRLQTLALRPREGQNVPALQTLCAVLLGSETAALQWLEPGEEEQMRIVTRHIRRTLYHLAPMGLQADEKTVQYDEKGGERRVFLKQKVGGLRVCLERA